MKKYLALVLSACVLLAFAACARQPQPAISTDTQQIPNPWTDYASLDEAEAAAGFDLAIPDAVDGCSEKQFRAMDADGDKMIEVIYASGENEIARIRKAPGAEPGVGGLVVSWGQPCLSAAKGCGWVKSGR